MSSVIYNDGNVGEETGILNEYLTFIRDLSSMKIPTLQILKTRPRCQKQPSSLSLLSALLDLYGRGYDSQTEDLESHFSYMVPVCSQLYTILTFENFLY